MARAWKVARGLVAVALLGGCGAGVVEPAPREAAGAEARSGLAVLNPLPQLPQIPPTTIQTITGEDARCGRTDGKGSALLDGQFAFVPDTTTARLTGGCATGVRCGIKISLVRYPSEVGTTEFLSVFVGNDHTIELRPGHFADPIGVPEFNEGPRSAVDYTFVPRAQDPAGDRPLGIDHRTAMSGAVEVNTVTRDFISGSFEVSFGFNGSQRLKGTFCAPVVPDL
jgi:hypothetical protein